MNRRQLIKAMALAAPLAGAALATGPGTITLRLRVRDDMSARLRDLERQYSGKIQAALYAEGERIMAESKRRHPLPWPDPRWPR